MSSDCCAKLFLANTSCSNRAADTARTSRLACPVNNSMQQARNFLLYTAELRIDDGGARSPPAVPTLTSSLLPGLLGGLSMTLGSGGSAASMMPRVQAVTRLTYSTCMAVRGCSSTPSTNAQTARQTTQAHSSSSACQLWLVRS